MVSNEVIFFSPSSSRFLVFTEKLVSASSRFASEGKFLNQFHVILALD